VRHLTRDRARKLAATMTRWIARKNLSGVNALPCQWWPGGQPRFGVMIGITIHHGGQFCDHHHHTLAATQRCAQRTAKALSRREAPCTQ